MEDLNMFCPVCGAKVDTPQGLIEHTQSVHSPEEMHDFLNQNKPVLPPQSIVNRGESFKKIYATDWIINLTSNDIRIEPINETREHPPGALHPQLPVLEFISESQIIATPVAAKSLLERLTEAIKLFEQQSQK